jgi:hypothetical protein
MFWMSPSIGILHGIECTRVAHSSAFAAIGVVSGEITVINDYRRRQAHNCHVNLRKPAAIDLLFLGPRLILAELQSSYWGRWSLA